MNRRSLLKMAASAPVAAVVTPAAPAMAYGQSWMSSPLLHHGGLVTAGLSSGEFPSILQHGEYIPLGRLRGSGFHPSDDPALTRQAIQLGGKLRLPDFERDIPPDESELWPGHA